MSVEVKMEEMFNDLDNLLKWADENGISADKLARNKNELLELKKLDLQKCNLKELPKELFNLTNLTVLGLNNNQLKELPKELFNLTNLTKLVLNNNQLSELPKEIENLTKLKKIYLGNNLLKELPKELFNLTNLTTLDLDNIKLKELPKELFNLTNLTWLDLSNNQLSELQKEIENLTKLEYIYLNGNKLKVLPDNIFNVITSLLNLKEFFIADNNIADIKNIKELNLSELGLEKLPTSILSLVNLEKLFVSHNDYFLPDNIFDTITLLPNLKECMFYDSNLCDTKILSFNCCLEKLPKSLFNLTNIIELNIGDDNRDSVRLEELPKEIGNLITLKKLSLDVGCLSELPKELSNLINLEEIKLISEEGNSSDNLPNNIFEILLLLPNIKELDLSGICLKNLPISLFNLTNLKRLTLNINELSEFPKEFANLVNLEELVLYGYSNLPNNIFEIVTLLPNLKEFYIHGNEENIADIKNIKELNLSFELENLPTSLFNLTNLKKLTFNVSKLSELPKEFANLVNLEKLVLNGDGNLPKDIFEILTLLSNLKELDCDYNITLSEEQIKMLDSFPNLKVNIEDSDIEDFDFDFNLY